MICWPAGWLADNAEPRLRQPTAAQTPPLAGCVSPSTGGYQRRTTKIERRCVGGSARPQATSSPVAARSWPSSSTSDTPGVGHGTPGRKRATLLAALADPNRGFDAIVVGEYERAFYGNQLLQLAPLFEQHGVQLWLPEVDGAVDHRSPTHQALAEQRRPRRHVPRVSSVGGLTVLPHDTNEFHGVITCPRSTQTDTQRRTLLTEIIQLSSPARFPVRGCDGGWPGDGWRRSGQRWSLTRRRVARSVCS